MIKTVFFDLDGTLIDQKRAQDEACKYLFFQYGFSAKTDLAHFINTWSELTEYYYEFYVRKECSYEAQRAMRIRALFARYAIALEAEQCLRIYDAYLSEFERNWAAYPDVLPCLQALQQKDYRLFILTNGDAKQQRQKLEKAGIDTFFSGLIAAGDHPVSKPSPDFFSIALEESGAAADECIHIGDSYRSDIAPCLALGMKCIYVNRGHKRMPSVPGLIQVASCCDIPRILESLNSAP